MIRSPTKNVSHTPGPWFVFHDRRTIQVGTSPEPGETRYAVVHWSGFDATDKPISEQVANARLIAAAPELLAALENLLAITNNQAPEAYEARRAIARASGDVR